MDISMELKAQMEEAPKLAKDDNSYSSLNLNNESADQHQPLIESNEPPIDFNTKNNQSNDSNALKRADKLLPCPRCESLNTKFCYYNNHNINQPRHFCKNCQRYWTSGGSMRNVPVGSGKRKSKHSISSVQENYEKAPASFFIDTTGTEPQKADNCFHLQGFPGPPWPYPWAVPMIMAPSTNLPFPFFPMLPVFPGTQNIGNQCSSEGRDKEEKKTFWIPKTLRVDNPEEAAKSSIWSTLGIKRDECVKRQCLFQNFEANEGNCGYRAPNAARTLFSNPAALARSRTFQESA